jgi:hypothetical protein
MSEPVKPTRSMTVGGKRPLGFATLYPPNEEPQPFSLHAMVQNGQNKIRVYYSTLGGEPPNGFSDGDEPPYILTPAGTSGKVYGCITINEYGEIDSRTLGIGSMPEPTDTTKYVEIGSYTVEDGVLRAVNARYGPIDVQICRNWFSNPATYGVTFS